MLKARIKWYKVAAEGMFSLIFNCYYITLIAPLLQAINGYWSFMLNAFIYHAKENTKKIYLNDNTFRYFNFRIVLSYYIYISFV